MVATISLKKCSHPNCSCLVGADQAYCSAQCAKTQWIIDCKCGHPGCKGSKQPNP